MYDRFIGYKDIFDGQGDFPECYDPRPGEVDPKIQQDLVTLFQIKEIDNQIENFLEIKDAEIRNLENTLHYSYDCLGERNDEEYNKIRSKNILENTKRKEEFSIVNKNKKIEVLRYIQQKGLIIDKLIYNDGEGLITCLSAVIGSVDVGEGDDDPCVWLYPEIVLDRAGHIQAGEKDDIWDMYLDDIKEIIVDDTRYIFPL